MAATSELKAVFDETAKSLQTAFDQAGIATGGQVTPAQLIDAVNQFLYVFDKLDREHGEKGLLPYDDASQLGDHAIGCLQDLAVWAERLRLPRQKQDLEKVALGTAHWVIRHEGELRTLEPIVNALAINANATEAREQLVALFHVLKDVIEHTAESVSSDLEQSDPTRPWRILNFNFAIVATRTQDKALMEKAFDTLGRNLPNDCPAFFEEGIRQAEKAGYGPDVKAMMQEYFSKWTTRH
jgi:hypothetical protein